MYQNCQVELKMLQSFLKDSVPDENKYSCKVIHYLPEKELLYLLTGKSELTEYSLDAIYQCDIKTEDDRVRCKGIILERYWNELGKILVFQVKNGFYKKSLN